MALAAVFILPPSQLTHNHCQLNFQYRNNFGKQSKSIVGNTPTRDFDLYTFKTNRQFSNTKRLKTKKRENTFVRHFPSNLKTINPAQI